MLGDLQPAVDSLLKLMKGTDDQELEYHNMCNALRETVPGWSAPSDRGELRPILAFKLAAETLNKGNGQYYVRSMLKHVAREILKDPTKFRPALAQKFFETMIELKDADLCSKFPVVDSYVINMDKKHIGKGASAEVRHAVDLRRMTRAAAKVLLPPTPHLFEKDRKKWIERVEKEVRIHQEAQGRVAGGVVSLLHSHACNGTELNGALYVIFMEFLPCTLSELVSHHHARVPAGHARRVLRVLASTFHKLSKGDAPIAHRDIKPENILLVSVDCEAMHLAPKVADFGFSRTYTVGNLMTTFGGTPMTMAPEVAMSPDGGYTEKADVWSFGATAYYVLTGQFPVLADDERMLYKRLLEIKPRSDWVREQLQARSPVVLQALEGSPLLELVIKCLEKCVDLRYSFEDVVNCLNSKNTTVGAEDALRNDLTAMKFKLAENESDMKALMEKLEKKAKENEKLKTRLEQLEAELSQQHNQRAPLEDHLVAFKADLDDERAKTARLEAQLDDERKARAHAEAQVVGLQADAADERAARVAAENAMVAVEADLRDERAKTAQLEANLRDNAEVRRQRAAFEEIIQRLVVYCHRWERHLGRVRTNVHNALETGPAFGSPSPHDQIYEAIFLEDPSLLQLPRDDTGIRGSMKFVLTQPIVPDVEETVVLADVTAALSNFTP